MRVLLVNDYPVKLEGAGGAEEHIKALYNALQELGHDAIIMTGTSRSELATCTEDYYVIPHLNAPPVRKNPLLNLTNLGKALRTAAKVVEYVKPDVIHVHNFLNPVALRFLRKLRPVVKSIHDCRPFCIKPPPYVATRLVGSTEHFCSRTFGLTCWPRCYMFVGKNLKDLIEGWSYFPHNLFALKEVIACDKLIVYSDYIKALALSKLNEPAKIELLHYFSDVENHTRCRKEDDSKPTLLFVGRHTFEKGIRHLIEAIRKVPPIDFETIILGDGPMKEEVEDLIKHLNPPKRIKMLGYVPRSQVLEYYRKASFIVFPSIGSEGCPLTGIESMYCGTPVIAFDVGGVREWLLHGKTGLLVERGNTDELAQAITKLLLDARLRRRLGGNAYAYVQKKFRRDPHIQKLVSVYNELAGKDLR